MKVLSGRDNGRRIEAPAGRAVRPTSARVRRSLFDMVESRFDLRECVVFDLFAGTGALGIEALSRGAPQAVFVDIRPESINVIRRNLATLRLEARASVTRMDVLQYVQRPWGPLDSNQLRLIFCDPPYDFDRWEAVLAHVPEGVVIVESNREIHVAPRWECLKMKSYGDTVVQLLHAQAREELISEEGRA